MVVQCHFARAGLVAVTASATASVCETSTPRPVPHRLPLVLAFMFDTLTHTVSHHDLLSLPLLHRLAFPSPTPPALCHQMHLLFRLKTPPHSGSLSPSPPLKTSLPSFQAQTAIEDKLLLTVRAIERGDRGCWKTMSSLTTSAACYRPCRWTRRDDPGPR